MEDWLVYVLVQVTKVGGLAKAHRDYIGIKQRAMAEFSCSVVANNLKNIHISCLLFEAFRFSPGPTDKENYTRSFQEHS